MKFLSQKRRYKKLSPFPSNISETETWNHRIDKHFLLDDRISNLVVFYNFSLGEYPIKFCRLCIVNITK